MTDKILILDFGSQVTQLIARRVRENGVYCEIHPFTMAEESIRDFAPRAIILSGGPASLTEAASPLLFPNPQGAKRCSTGFARCRKRLS